MTTFATDQVQDFGHGVLQAEGVVVDKDGFVYGGGRNGIIYKVSPDGEVHKLLTLPEGSIPNGIALGRNGDIIYCDLGKQGVYRATQSGQVSMIAEQVGNVKLTPPNFCSYDAEGNIFVSNTSDKDENNAMLDLAGHTDKSAGAYTPRRKKRRGRYRLICGQRHSDRSPRGSDLCVAKLHQRLSANCLKKGRDFRNA